MYPEWAKYSENYIRKNKFAVDFSNEECIPEMFQVSTNVENISQFENLIRAYDYFMIKPNFFPVEIYYFYIKNRKLVLDFFEHNTYTCVILFSKIINEEICKNRHKILDYMELIGEEDKELIRSINFSFEYKFNIEIKIENENMFIYNNAEHKKVQNKYVKLILSCVCNGMHMINFDEPQVSIYTKYESSEPLLFNIVSQYIFANKKFDMGDIRYDGFELKYFSEILYITDFNRKFFSDLFMEIYEKFYNEAYKNIDIVYDIGSIIHFPVGNQTISKMII